MSDVPQMELRELEPQPVVCVHLVLPMAEADMRSLFARYLPLVAARIGELGLSPIGASFSRFHQWGGDVADMEIGFPVADPPSALEPVATIEHGEPGLSELPGGTAAVALHRGPYKDLPTVYPKLQAWIRSQGRTEGSGPWEVYIDDPGTVDHKTLRTEVVWPLS